MSDRSRRRTFLRAAVAGSGVLLAGCSTTESEPEHDPDELRDRIAELEDELDAYETAIDDAEASLEALSVEIDTFDLDERQFSEETRERMRTVALDARESVVRIIDDDDPERGATGWVYDDGLVATNAHVVAPHDDDVEIETFDGDRRSGETLAMNEDREPDIALIETSTDGLDPLPIGTADGLNEGDPIIGLGHPFGVGQWVIALGAYLGPGDTRTDFATDVPTRGGASGSPVLDRDGDVVGMHYGGTPRSDPPTIDSVSRSQAVFERYPDTMVRTADRIDDVVERFDEWID